MANKDRSARRKSEASPASKALKRLLKEQEKAKQSLTVFEQRKLTQAEKGPDNGGHAGRATGRRK